MAKPTEVKFEIDLEEMFGESPPDSQSFKEDIGQAVLDRIIERTQDGMDKAGRSFYPYSDAYAKKKGVSAGDVDMTLFGDMLAAMDILEIESSKIFLGFTDELENAKAFNHINGDTVPKRDFFGLPKKDLKEIASRFRSEFEELKSRGQGSDDSDEETDSILRGILAGQFDRELGI